MDTSTDGSSDLAGDAIQKSITGSLERMKRPEGVCVERKVISNIFC